ncbi:hypothetical protein L208DRAFT_1384054 [Tricholoma matsutake]|nr:hypothetical protein L208DRAFT_1384054 [Tricholoma matsutake 945]
MVVGWVHIVFFSQLLLLLVGVLVLSRWQFWWRCCGPLVLFVLVFLRHGGRGSSCRINEQS